MCTSGGDAGAAPRHSAGSGRWRREPIQRWAMDFMHDVLLGGAKVRVCTLIDVWRRECLALRAATTFTGSDVAATLEDVRSERRALPPVIQCDNVLPKLPSCSLKSELALVQRWLHQTVAMRSDAFARIARWCFHQHEALADHSQHSAVSERRARGMRRGRKRACRSSHSVRTRWKVRALSTRSALSCGASS
jgi:transposase InsO family protein